MIHVVCLDPRCLECGAFWDTQLGIIGQEAEAPAEAE